MDQYILTDEEQQALFKTLAPGNDEYAICPECENIVKISFLRKKPEDKLQQMSCLACFGRLNPDLVG